MKKVALPFSRRWRSLRTVWALFAIELAFTVPALALFAIAQPNLYRTRLWQDGFNNGFNSNPLASIYAMVNRTPYTTPVVWRQFLTDFNVVISVLSMFFLLVKGVMFIMHLFWPVLGLLVHGLLTALWGYSVWAQTAPDNSDPRFPRLSAPWYIVKSCNVAHDKGNIEYCKQAKAALAVSAVMLFLFLANTILAIISMVPSKIERLARKTKLDEEKHSSPEQQSQMRFAAPPMSAKQKAWEKHGSAQGHYAPKTPGTPSTVGGMKTPTLGAKTPITPRTMAFNRLGGGSDLPLRR